MAKKTEDAVTVPVMSKQHVLDMCLKFLVAGGFGVDIEDNDTYKAFAEVKHKDSGEVFCVSVSSPKR